jgi:hypothetical protein
LRIIDLSGRIVEDDDRIMPPLVTEPLVFAAVNVQQHAGHRSPHSPPTMLAPPFAARHQASPLQSLLHPDVAQLDAMFFAQLLMEMPDVQVMLVSRPSDS